MSLVVNIASPGCTQKISRIDAVNAELAWLEALLAEGSYLAGDRYTLAEPGYWPWIVRLHRVGADLSSYPAVSAWSERLAARPEYAAELSLLLG